MPDWNSGYITDINYTAGYYEPLNPLRARLAFACKGVAFPEIRTACELGFGEGVSIGIHAAASDAAWYGTDFNASQVNFARCLAGDMADLRDASFEEFLEAPDLPDFDFIGLHGIWSWISPENQQRIVDFVRRKCRVGGVFYISYNVYPGWSAFAPLRHLAKLHYDSMGAPVNGVEARVKEAFSFLTRCAGVQPAFMTRNPVAAERLEHTSRLNARYLAHEYFNMFWEPVYFADMLKKLSEAKLNYACSAALLDQVANFNLSREQQEFLSAIPDPMLRESTFDFMINQQFRRDYWVRGARRLGRVEQARILRGLPVVLTSPASLPLTFKCVRGEVKLEGKLYAAVLDCLADHRPHTIGELERHASENSFAELISAVLVLSGAGYVTAANSAETAEAVSGKCATFNRRVMESTRDNAGVSFCASPVTGGGVPVDRFEQLFLEAMSSGCADSAGMAGYAWRILEERGERLLREGAALESPEENLAELTRKAGDFLEKRMPLLKVLGVC